MRTVSQKTFDGRSSMRVSLRPRLVCFPGQGMLFWWQQGAASTLGRYLDVSGAATSGASAGACSAVLAACGVKPEDSLAVALDLSHRARVFERPFGLAGVWGGLVRRWLDRLLPHDAHARCDGRVHISLLEVLPWRRRLVSDFSSRESLIDTVMASAHVPCFMDGWPVIRHRGRFCIDAGVAAAHAQLLTADAADAIRADARGDDASASGGLRAFGAGGVFTVCYSHDPLLAKLRRSDLLRLQTPDGLSEMLRRGAEYAEREYVPRLATDSQGLPPVEAAAPAIAESRVTK